MQTNRLLSGLFVFIESSEGTHLQLTSVDHLVSLSPYWTGAVLSVTNHPPGFAVIIRADNNLPGYKRLAANNRDFTTKDHVHPGDTVQFLPGNKAKPGCLARAYDVSIVHKKIRKPVRIASESSKTAK